MNKLVDIIGLKAIVKKIYDELGGRIKALEEIDHGKYLTEHQDLKAYAKSEDVPKQPNYVYDINMVASDQAPSVVTEGAYPNLKFIFNIPAGSGGNAGGGEEEPPGEMGDPENTIYYGYLPYDETGEHGYFEEDLLEENWIYIHQVINERTIQIGVRDGMIIKTVATSFPDRATIRVTDDSCISFVLVQKNSPTYVKLDNGIGGKVDFKEDASHLGENGQFTIFINNTEYRVYGYFSTIPAPTVVHILEE